MKVVQVCPYELERPGGVQRHILSLAGELEQRGHDVAIVAPGPGPQVPVPGRHYAGRKRVIGFSGTRFEISHVEASTKRALMAELSEWGADIFHFHTIWTPIMPFQLFAACSAARVATFHDTPPDTILGKSLRLAFMGMSRWFLKRLDGAIAVSEAPAQHLRPGSNGIVPQIVPPATDLSGFRAAATQARERHDDCFRVLFVGRLEPRKGVVSLLEAWRLLPGLLSGGITRPLELVVAGQGPLRQRLEAMVRETSQGSVRFVVAPDETSVISLMRQCDVFVAPSLYGESFGIVLGEAMSAGLPVIAADNLGYASVMRGGGEPWLYPAGDAVALAERIIVAAHDEEARQAAISWGVEHAASFDIAEVAPRIEELYESALAEKRVPSACSAY